MGDRLFSDETDESIARLVVAGESNKAIAARLGLPEGTVKWRIHRMYGRMGVQSRTRFVLQLSLGSAGPDHGDANTTVKQETNERKET